VSDDAKKAILARRAKFVAAAMASLAATSCGKERAAPSGDPSADPRACLKVHRIEPAPDAAQPSPRPCLEMAMPDPPDAATPPSPCLRVPSSHRVDAGPCDPHDPLCAPSPKRPAARPCLLAPLSDEDD
jgi:hypothetical protein